MERVSHSFPADDPRLGTAIGTRAERLIRVNGKNAGVALYGPYIHLPPGTYQAIIRFDPATACRGTAMIDVCSRIGLEVLEQQSLTADQIVDQDMSACVRFSSAQALLDVEVRLHCGNDFVAAIRSVEILSDDLCSPAEAQEGTPRPPEHQSSLIDENLQAQPIIECGGEDRPASHEEDGVSADFAGQSEFWLLLGTVQAVGIAQHQPLLGDPVFVSGDQRGAFQHAPSDPKAGEPVTPPGPLAVDTRADSAIFSTLDPDYASEDIPLTRHMTHTWHRFALRHRFHLNSDQDRLAFIVWYYQSHSQSRSRGAGALPAELVTGLNAPAQAHGPLTRFLFAIWQSEYRERAEFDLQREDGYVNFLTELALRRASARHFPDELLPDVLLTAIRRPVLGDPPHQLSKAAYSIWQRSEAYRKTYGSLDDWRMRQVLNFELIIDNYGANLEGRLIAPEAIEFWSGAISPRLAGLSRFAAVLACISPRFGGDGAISPAKLVQDAPAIAGWFREEVVPRFPQFGVFLTTPVVSREAQRRLPQSGLMLRSELRRIGVDCLPSPDAEEIDLLVIGPIAAQSGLGAGTRRSIGALERTQCNFRTLHLAYDNPSIMVSEPDKREYRGENPRAILWHFNAEYLQECLHLLQVFTKGRYNIGYFFWETEVMPNAHQLSVAMVDEIWTPSQFVAKCYSVAEVPVVNVGTSVQLPKLERFLGRDYFGFADEFVFMYSFDGHSVIHRKNPAAAVRAFFKAFPDKTAPVRLVLKTQNLMENVWGPVNGRREQLFELCAKDPRVEIIDRTMTLAEYYSLKEACDCYISLHRSEGFGYGPAEAMALGKPVIMTNYSANVEFATRDNCLLVDATLVHVRDGEYLYWVPAMMWAEVDIDHAAAQMRRVFEDREFAAELGRRAKTSINRDFGPDAMARRYAKRLTELGLNGNSDESARRATMLRSGSRAR